MNQELLLLILELIVVITIGIISKYVIPFVKNSTDQNTLNLIIMWIKESVHAADQILNNNNGSEKKEFVNEFIKKILDSNDIAITDEELDILIESAVKQMKIQSK